MQNSIPWVNGLDDWLFGNLLEKEKFLKDYQIEMWRKEMVEEFDKAIIDDLRSFSPMKPEIIKKCKEVHIFKNANETFNPSF